MAKLFHFDPGVTSCTAEGVEFVQGEDGAFEVPESAVQHLIHHGFATSLEAAKAAAVPAVAETRKAVADAEARADHAEAQLAQAVADVKSAHAEIEALRVQVSELTGQVEALTRPGKRRG